METNYIGLALLLGQFANDFEKRGHGCIIGISSVAGDRGRKTNYIYGSAKAGFTAFLSGLRNRLYGFGVRVMTVKPGFVRTTMTEKMDLFEKLTATPEQVAQDVYKAYTKGKDVLYTLWFWRWIMLAINNIPEFIFKRLSL
jgi:short-subunit dehydrogenase